LVSPMRGAMSSASCRILSMQWSRCSAAVKMAANFSFRLLHADIMRRAITVTLQLAQDHGLTADEYGRIVQILGRTPTLEQLGVFSVMWSAHCSDKSSRRLLRQLPATGPEGFQWPGENAGIVGV